MPDSLPVPPADLRRRIREAFAAAAAHYDHHAEVQRAIVANLLAWIELSAPARLPTLDAGCGTGYASAALRTDDAPVIGLDLADTMARQALRRGEHGIAGDLECLPLRDGCVGRYWSSLAWQWCASCAAAAEAARVLTSGGVLQVATLGPYTLRELRDVFAAIDGAEHVRSFEPPDAVLAALRHAGFRSIRFKQCTQTGFAPDLASLLRDIRGVGAHTLGDSRRRGMLGRQAWQRLCDAYEVHREAAGLPARYDVLMFEAIR